MSDRDVKLAYSIFVIMGAYQHSVEIVFVMCATILNTCDQFKMTALFVQRCFQNSPKSPPCLTFRRK